MAAVPSAPAAAQEPEKPHYTFYEDLPRPDSAVPKAMTPPPAPKEAVGETAVAVPRPPETAPPVPEGPLDAASPGRGGEKPLEKPRPPEAPVRTAQAKGAEAPKPVEVAKAAKEPKTAETKPAEPTKTPAPKRAGEPQKSPSAEKTPPDARSPPSKASDSGGKAAPVETKTGAPSYTVQVGSFKDRASAEDQAKKIAEKGVSAQVVQAPMEGRMWFRVQVGRYGTRAEAESYYQKKLRPKGIQGFVTQK